MLTKIQFAFSLLSRFSVFATNESEIKSKLSRGGNAIYNAFDPCTHICIYLLRFFFFFFFFIEKMLCSREFRWRGGRDKIPESKKWRNEREYSRWSDRVCRKTRDRLKLNPLKGISPCVHSCTLGFAADSFRALAPLLHIKIKKSVFKFNPRFFCGVSCRNGTCVCVFFSLVSKHARDSSLFSSALYPYVSMCIEVRFFILATSGRERECRRKNFKGRGET